MVSPHEKMAESLAVLRALQERGVAAVRSADMTRTHRARLVKNGFLHEVMKSWYPMPLSIKRRWIKRLIRNNAFDREGYHDGQIGILRPDAWVWSGS